MANIKKLMEREEYEKIIKKTKGLIGALNFKKTKTQVFESRRAELICKFTESVEKVNKSEAKAAMVMTKNAEWCYKFACKFEDELYSIKDLQGVVMDSLNYELMIRFARDVKRAEISDMDSAFRGADFKTKLKYIKAVAKADARWLLREQLNSEDPAICLELAKLNRISVGTLQEVVDKHGSLDMKIEFLRSVEGARSDNVFRQVMENPVPSQCLELAKTNKLSPSELSRIEPIILKSDDKNIYINYLKNVKGANFELFKDKLLSGSEDNLDDIEDLINEENKDVFINAANEKKNPSLCFALLSSRLIDDEEEIEKFLLIIAEKGDAQLCFDTIQLEIPNETCDEALFKKLVSEKNKDLVMEYIEEYDLSDDMEDAVVKLCEETNDAEFSFEILELDYNSFSSEYYERLVNITAEHGTGETIYRTLVNCNLDDDYTEVLFKALLDRNQEDLIYDYIDDNSLTTTMGEDVVKYCKQNKNIDICLKILDDICDDELKLEAIKFISEAADSDQCFELLENYNDEFSVTLLENIVRNNRKDLLEDYISDYSISEEAAELIAKYCKENKDVKLVLQLLEEVGYDEYDICKFVLENGDNEQIIEAAPMADEKTVSKMLKKILDSKDYDSAIDFVKEIDDADPEDLVKYVLVNKKEKAIKEFAEMVAYEFGYADELDSVINGTDLKI